MSEFKFNVNRNVKVKLTSIGIAELKRQHEELKSSFPKLGEFKAPAVDEDGYSEFQLWSLMERLGHLCVIGFQLPFETDIKITFNET